MKLGQPLWTDTHRREHDHGELGVIVVDASFNSM
jgi:hypothetical protein